MQKLCLIILFLMSNSVFALTNAVVFEHYGYNYVVLGENNAAKITGTQILNNKVFKTNNPTPLDKNNPVSIRLNHDGMTIYAENIGKIIRFTDPYTQENFITIPLDNMHVPKIYQFIKFNLLPTKIGVAIQVIGNNIRVKIAQNKIYIQSHPVYGDIIDKNAPLYNFKRWLGAESFRTTENQLLLAVTKAHDKTKQRFALAQLYLSHNLIPETIAYLKYMAQEDDSVQNTTKYQLLKAAALYENSEYQGAQMEFNAVDTSDMNNAQIAELEFWQDATSIQLNTKGANLSFLFNQDAFLQHYTNTAPFALLAYKSAINNKLFKIANRMRNILTHMQLSEEENDQLHLIQADYFIKISKPDKVLESYDIVAKSATDIKNKALAVYKKANYLLNNQRISIAEAIKQLEPLTAIQRNTGFEAQLLQELGNLYTQNKNYYLGLLTYKSLIKYANKYINVIDTMRTMSNIFAQLFLENHANDIPALEAVTIFYDFPELLPVGSTGIPMTMHIIDRLVELDLLTQASNLLSHMIKFRLHENKENATNKLIKIYMDNKEFDKTLELVNTMPASNTTRKAQLRILMHKQKYDKALAIAKQDDERAKILFYQRNWKPLQKLIEPKLEYRKDPKQPLSQQEKLYAYYLGIAYTATSKTNSMKNLYNAFHEQINNPTFNFLYHMTKPMQNTDLDKIIE